MFVFLKRDWNPTCRVECDFCVYQEGHEISQKEGSGYWGIPLDGSWELINARLWCGGCDPRGDKNQETDKD